MDHPTPAGPVQLLTIAEAAKAAKVSVDTIRRRIADGSLVAINYGTHRRAEWRIDPQALKAVQPVAPAHKNGPAELNRPGRRPRRRAAATPHGGRVSVW